MMVSYQMILAGVGGQGIVTLTSIIGDAAIKSSLKVTGSETHGMAQRGGSVVAHLRIGKNPIAPLITDGSADILLALEPSEALRHVKSVKNNGAIIYSTNAITPSSVTIQHKEYPPLEPIFEKLTRMAEKVYPINFKALLEDKIGMRSLNIAFLGALVEFWEQNDINNLISLESFLEVIRERWPKYFEKNRLAMELGRESIKKMVLTQ